MNRGISAKGNPMIKFLPLFLVGFLLPAACTGENLEKARHAMVAEQIAGRGVTNPRVLEAMRTVPRHLFVRPEDVSRAYSDRPLYIADGQTISQPYIVAFMTELLRLKGEEKVLEIGTGSGYQAAVLSRLCREVYTIEIVKSLHERAFRIFEAGDYKNIFSRHGDGYLGWEEKGPFDAIMITAAAPRIPPPLVEQLKDGGILVLPLGENRLSQTLTVVTKKGGRIETEEVLPVIFVPMTGKVEE